MQKDLRFTIFVDLSQLFELGDGVGPAKEILKISHLLTQIFLWISEAICWAEFWPSNITRDVWPSKIFSSKIGFLFAIFPLLGQRSPQGMLAGRTQRPNVVNAARFFHFGRDQGENITFVLLSTEKSF